MERVIDVILGRAAVHLGEQSKDNQAGKTECSGVLTESGRRAMGGNLAVWWAGCQLRWGGQAAALPQARGRPGPAGQRCHIWHARCQSQSQSQGVQKQARTEGKGTGGAPCLLYLL